MICTPQIKKRWVGNVAHMLERRCTCRVVVGKHKSKRPLGRLRCGWENNIKMALPKSGLERVDRINLVNKVMNIRVP